jgi:DNA phosphorothioation-dependent restriction protein DptG
MAKKPVDPIAKLTEAVEKLTKRVANIEKHIDEVVGPHSLINVVHNNKLRDERFGSLFERVGEIEKENKRINDCAKDIGTLWGLFQRVDELEEKVEEQENDNIRNIEDLRQHINRSVDEEEEEEEAQAVANPQEGGFFAWLTGAPKCGKCGRRCRVSNQNGSQFMHQQYVRGANGLELNNIMKESYSCEFCGSTTTTANNYRV